MATEKGTKFSTLGLRSVIIEPDGRPQIKMEVQELESVREQESAGEDCLATIPADVAPQRLTAAPKQCIKQELLAQGPLSQQWEVQWPELLHASLSPTPEQSGPWLPQNRLRDDAKTSQPCFEGVVATSHWARNETIARLRPRLSNRTTRETQNLNYASGRDEEEQPRRDAIVDPLSSEHQRQRFRQFDYKEAEGPWEAYCQLRKFCHQWLMPEAHTKEEIMELVILEQFLTILPQEMLNWIKERDSESCFHAVALAEHFLRRQRQEESQDQPQPQMPGMMQEETLDFSAKEDASLNVNLQQLYREVKQEQEEDASLVAVESGNENEEMLQEREDPPDLEETISNQAEPRKPQEQDTEILKNESITSEVEALSETTVQPAISKGKRPSDRLFHSLNKLQRSQTGEELYECSDCGKNFISRAGFIMHIRIHGREKPYECSDCGKHFRRSSHLNSHSKIHAGVKPFKCTDCGKGFSRSSNLISHQRMHTGEKPYTCSSCSKQFCDKSSLVRHERLHTGDKPYKCTECGKSFSQSHHLITHQRSHTGEKPYKCLLCNKSFCDRSTYIRHQKNHNGEKTFKCLDCGECFSRNKHLVRHRSIHTARELYTCSDCGESFCRRSGLKMHQKIHTGEKPFECTDCGKKFNRSTNLISHQRIHTGERPYGCPECGKRFNRRTHLVSHQKIHGPRKEATGMLGAGGELPSAELKGGYVPPSYIITTIV
ncbi:zinc finger protein 397-like isoform X2 [Sceloporus undulatus]|uniref:zinc finger protein 397-like isoform X2 n=1 Tax=Sceloporus undulatus TaxID=8520 RepID=UPI001C4C7353|nr:zinc finger protein 397-like isoform X2 [Sceloporus undulatus]